VKDGGRGRVVVERLHRHLAGTPGDEKRPRYFKEGAWCKKSRFGKRKRRLVLQERERKEGTDRGIWSRGGGEWVQPLTLAGEVCDHSSLVYNFMGRVSGSAMRSKVSPNREKEDGAAILDFNTNSWIA